MTAAQFLLTGANPGLRIPVWKTPPSDPISTKIARGLAIGLALFAVISLDGQIAWWWGLVLMVAVFLPGGLFVMLHNHRVADQQMS